MTSDDHVAEMIEDLRQLHRRALLINTAFGATLNALRQFEQDLTELANVAQDILYDRVHPRSES